MSPRDITESESAQFSFRFSLWFICSYTTTSMSLLYISRRKRSSVQSNGSQPGVAQQKKDVSTFFRLMTLLNKTQEKNVPQNDELAGPSRGAQVHPEEPRFSALTQPLVKAREEGEALQPEITVLRKKYRTVLALEDQCRTLTEETAKSCKENEQLRDYIEKMKKKIHQMDASVKLLNALTLSKASLIQENKLLQKEKAKLTEEYDRLGSMVFKCKVDQEEADRVKQENENLKALVRVLNEKIINKRSDYLIYCSMKLPDEVLRRENYRLNKTTQELAKQLYRAATVQESYETITTNLDSLREENVQIQDKLRAQYVEIRKGFNMEEELKALKQEEGAFKTLNKDLRRELSVLRHKKLRQEKLNDKIQEARESRVKLVQQYQEMRGQTNELYCNLQIEKFLKVSLGSEKLQREAMLRQKELAKLLLQQILPTQPHPPPSPEAFDLSPSSSYTPPDSSPSSPYTS